MIVPRLKRKLNSIIIDHRSVSVWETPTFSFWKTSSKYNSHIGACLLGCLCPQGFQAFLTMRAVVWGIGVLSSNIYLIIIIIIIITLITILFLLLLLLLLLLILKTLFRRVYIFSLGTFCTQINLKRKTRYPVHCK